MGNNKVSKKVGLGLLVVALLLAMTSCENSATPVAVATASHTLIHVPFATEMLSSTAMKPVRVTATSTPTATTANVEIPLSYDLPTWMGEPESNILASLKWNDVGIYVSFLNASTGELLDLPLGPNLREYFWVDNMHFGFLSSDRKTMYLVDMKTGKIKIEALKADNTRLLRFNDYYGGLAMIRTPDDVNNFIFAYSDTENIHYKAEKDYSQETNPIKVTDRITGNVIWLSNFKDDLDNVVFSWSPVKDSYLAILRGEIPLNMQRWDMWGLVIVDVRTGNIIFQSRGDFTGFSWSPDGSKIIVERGSKYTYPDGRVGTGYEQIPCIIYLSDSHIKCLSTVRNSHIPNNTVFNSAVSYSWDPNGTNIRYLYTYEPQDLINWDKVQLGNLCIYNLIYGMITCPTEDLAALRGRGILGYKFSPDGQYAYFCYSTAGYRADFVGDENDAVIDMKGFGFTTWKAIQSREWTLQCTLSAFWRPLP
jgi:hypothetical protein